MRQNKSDKHTPDTKGRRERVRWYEWRICHCHCVTKEKDGGAKPLGDKAPGREGRGEEEATAWGSSSRRRGRRSCAAAAAAAAPQPGARNKNRGRERRRRAGLGLRGGVGAKRGFTQGGREDGEDKRPRPLASKGAGA